MIKNICNTIIGFQTIESWIQTCKDTDRWKGYGIMSSDASEQTFCVILNSFSLSWCHQFLFLFFCFFPRLSIHQYPSFIESWCFPCPVWSSSMSADTPSTSVSNPCWPSIKHFLISTGWTDEEVLVITINLQPIWWDLAEDNIVN